MAIAYEILDDNSGFVAEVPLIIPIKWRTRVTTTTALTGDSFDLPVNPTDPPTPALCGSSTTFGDWEEGGEAGISRQVCLYQNGSAFISRKEFAILYRPFSIWSHVSVSLTGVYVFTDTNIEIDMEDALAQVREQFDPRFFRIGAVRFTDSDGENPQNLGDLINLDKLNGVYQDTTHLGEEVLQPLIEMATNYKYGNYTTPYGPDYPNDETIFKKVTDFNIHGVSGDEAGAAFNNVAKNVATNTCVGNGRTVPMYLKVYVAATVAFSGATSWADPEETQQKTNGEDSGSSSGGAGVGGSGAGSAGGQGLNSTTTQYGNSQLPFSSVFLTGSNYNNFVTAGGGIVAESGVFPNSTALYIDKVRLSLEGSTMTVVEVKKFDETPSLNLSEKVFGYVFDDNNVSKPIFTGYVVSRQRTLSDNTQEITYECRDLSFFFDQLYTPSFYLYRPPTISGGGTTKTYDRVLKEILNGAGIPDAVVNIPSLDAPPIEWVYEPVNSVLEWSTKYFGKYVSYIDRYGRLNVRAIDSGNFIKNIAIPAEGTAVGTTYKVLDLKPVSDYSRSRSRIILAGDFPLEERVYNGKFNLKGPVNPADAHTTGFYWYYQSISIYGTTRFYYFCFSTSDTLLDKLLSDPQKNAEVKMTINTPLSGVGYAPGLVATTTVTLPINNFESDVGGGRILATLDMSAFGTGSIIPSELVTSPTIPSSNVTTTKVDYNFEVRYAVKKNAPIQVSMDTGLTGGTEVLKRPEFKKISGGSVNVDDSALMRQYLDVIQEFYKPNFGGGLEMDGLDLDLELLGQVNITGTALPDAEADNMIIYEIEYDVPKKKTSLNLSNRVYEDLPFFDVIRERSRSANESLVKIGLLEQSALYNQR